MEKLHCELHCGYIACGQELLESPHRPGERNMAGLCSPSLLWRAVEELAGELNGESADVAVVVHYSGYGYDRAGAPRWLAEALEGRPRQLNNVRIITLFHELYATGWPWQRAFWYSLQQRLIGIRVARASDALVTNREVSARWLERASSRAHASVASLPIASNVGEPREIVPWALRAPVAVIFGSARFKRPFLCGRAAHRVASLCRKLDIKTLVSIGARAEVEEHVFRSSGVEVAQTGIIPAEEVSFHYRVARFALVDYFSGYYSKSGVLAAAASHGTPPIFPRAGMASDGLKFGEHLWDLKSAMTVGVQEALARLASISRSIRVWYDGHNVEKHARLLGATVFRNRSWSAEANDCHIVP
jgi:hypothetical protein